METYYMNIKQAAEYAGYNPETWYNYRMRCPEKLPPLHIAKNGAVRIRKDELDEWLTAGDKS